MRETLVKTEEFKDSPLGRLPQDWKVIKLGDVTDIENGTTPSREEPKFWSEGAIPWLTTGKVHDRFINQADEFITEYALRLCSLRLLPIGTVLVAMIGQGLTRGKVAYLASEASINQNFGAILPCSSLDSRFLFHYLDFNYEYVRGSSRGSNQQALNCAVIAQLQVVCPPKEEQRRIAEILDTVDKTIAHTSSLIAKLKQMKAGLLHDLLTRGLDENGELRDAIGYPEQFKDSPLGRIPKDWEATTIGEQASTSSGSTPNRSNPKYWQDGTIAWVKTGEVNYTFIQDTEEKITQKALNETSLTVYPVDTVLMAMYGQGVTRGKVGILGIESTTNQACAAIIPKDNKLVSRYLFHYLSYYYDEIRSMSHGSNQSNLNERLIASFPIHLPPIKEQIRIVEMIDSHDTRIRTEEAYRDKLKLQKKGLMHDLLTGKLRVKDADQFTSVGDTV